LDGPFAPAAFRSWRFPIVIVILGLGFALVPLAQDRMFFYWDNAQQHFAQTVFLQNGLEQGAIPQWWPNAGMGFPATAEGQAAHYHPIRLVCAWLFSAPAALMWELALYFAIAGLSTFFFLREFRLQRSACLLGAVSQMFCSFALVYVRNIALHRSFCLLPLAMLCAERFVRGRTRAWLWAALVIGLQFLAGHPSLAIVTVIGSAAYVGFRSASASWSRRPAVGEAAGAALTRVVLWGGAAALGFGIAAVQVIPMLLHVEQSQRQGGLSFESAVEVLPATVRGLGQLFFPFAYVQGDFLPARAPWGFFNPVPTAGMYSGVLCAILAPLALWWHRGARGPALPLAASLVVALGFALGPSTPLFPLLRSLPGMSGLRFPNRYLLWAAFALSCLAALGAHRLIAQGRLRTSVTRRLTPVGAVAGVIVLLAALAAVLLPAGRSGVFVSLAWYAAAFSLVAWTAVARGTSRRMVPILLVALAAGDLLFFRTRGGYAPTTPIEEALTVPEPVKALQQTPLPFRVLALKPSEVGAFFNDELRDFIQADLCTAWNIDSSDVFLSLYVKRHYAVRLSIVHELLNQPDSATRLAPFLAAMNVRFVTAPAGLVLQGWKRVSGGTAAAIWENPVVLPRAYLVGRVVAQRFDLRDDWQRRGDVRLAEYRRDIVDWASRAVDAQILDHVMSAGLDYGVTAEVDSDDTFGIDGIGRDAAVAPTAGRPDEMRFTVTTDRPGYLVVSNTHYPGWTATVNNQPARLFQTNWVMTGLPVPAGRSEVVLRYRTPGYAAGLPVSLLLLAIVGALILKPAVLERAISPWTARRGASPYRPSRR
jgi:hypothetical protein